MKTIFLLLFAPIFMIAQTTELGTVDWIRDFDKAQQIAKQDGKNILILFQEVPGCATCRNYGKNVLSDPLVVEMIEDLFVPLAVFNNLGGKDKEILMRYEEPSWNNPVVRIVDAAGENIVPRLAGTYSKQGLVDRVVMAYDRLGLEIPGYVQLIHQELNADKKEAYYSMYCFWSGEALFGKKDGVLKTEAAWMNGKEVVKIIYDPNEISSQELNRVAETGKCSAENYNNNYRVDKEPQYYLEHSKYAALDLTSLQRTKVNADLGNKRNPERWLSPGQLARL